MTVEVFAKARWVALLVGNGLGLLGCTFFDYVYPLSDFGHGALGFGLIASGVFWMSMGLWLFDPHKKS